MSSSQVEKIQENFFHRTPSFEETYENSYSHGLEEIYALETVDIKSVRKIQTVEIATRNGGVGRDLRCNWDQLSNVQMSFPFGDPFQFYPLSKWMKEIMGGLDNKTQFFLLQPYGLSGNISLTPGEKLEVQRLGEGTIRDMISLGKQQLHRHKTSVYLELQKITQVYLTPWMYRRGGVVKEWELRERLRRMVDQMDSAEGWFRFLSDYFFQGCFPFTQHLVDVEKDVFCSDSDVGQRYRQLVKVALSYFYQPSISYRPQELVGMIVSETKALYGSEDFVKRVLKCCSEFNLTARTITRR